MELLNVIDAIAHSRSVSKWLERRGCTESKYIDFKNQNTNNNQGPQTQRFWECMLTAKGGARVDLLKRLRVL